MHPNAHNFVARQVAAHGPFARVLEIGSRDVNGSVRHLFDGAAYLGIDLTPGPCVDVIADGANYHSPIPVDCVVCCEVLEHAPNPGDIVANAVRNLAPGGWLILTCAGPGRAPHGWRGDSIRPGEHYANVSQMQLREWLLGMECIETCHYVEWPECGDCYAVARRPSV